MKFKTVSKKGGIMRMVGTVLKGAKRLLFVMFCFLSVLFFTECGELLQEDSSEGESSIIDEENCGIMRLAINELSFSEMKEQMFDRKSVWSRNMEELDTNDFILSIYSEYGSKVYEGKYGKRPSEINVVPGNYNVKIRSSDFKEPAFDSPVYGDEKSVRVIKDSIVSIVLVCKQINSAIRLTFTETFKQRFKGEGIKLQDTNGFVLYPYTTDEYCYVTPGSVELLYNNSISDTLLYAKQIQPQQMLTLNLSYSQNSKNTVFRLDNDTVRIWKTENFDAGLRIPTGAVTIEQAKEMIGEKNVMVFGFVLGGDVTENTIRVKPPFSSRTSLILATSMRERNRYNMFAVELPGGEIREALNLVDNRELLGSAIVVVGNIVESYYGYPGIKNTKTYSILY